MPAVRAYISISVSYFRSNFIAAVALSAIIALTILTSVVYVFYSYIQRDIFNAIADKNSTNFYSSVFKYLGVILILVPIAIFRNYINRRLAVHWRESLTSQILTVSHSN